MIQEDIGNRDFSTVIKLDGKDVPFHFSIFNNAFGQVCTISADTKQCQLDNNLQVITAFKFPNMPVHWIEAAKIVLLDHLDQRVSK